MLYTRGGDSHIKTEDGSAHRTFRVGKGGFDSGSGVGGATVIPFKRLSTTERKNG